MSDEHIPDVPPEVALQFAEIDLAIEEAIRELDDSLDFEDEIDRTLVLHLLRWAYIQGYTDRHNEQADA